MTDIALFSHVFSYNTSLERGLTLQQQSLESTTSTKQKSTMSEVNNNWDILGQITSMGWKYVMQETM